MGFSGMLLGFEQHLVAGLFPQNTPQKSYDQAEFIKLIAARENTTLTGFNSVLKAGNKVIVSGLM